MCSTLTRDLFQRAIVQSGATIGPYALAEPGRAKRNANKVGKLLDCPTDKSSALVDCLKKKNAVDIVTTDTEFMVFGFCPVIPFRPVVEPDHPGAFIKEDPVVTLKSGKVADIPLMTGVVPQEGAIKAAAIYGSKDVDFLNQLDENFIELAPITLLYEDTCPEELKANVSKSIREFYLGDKKIDESTRWNIIDMYSDSWFIVAGENTVRVHLETTSSPIYYYVFAYRGSSSFSTVFGDSERDYGVAHADELQYLFPISKVLFPNTPFTEEDQKVVDIMTELWTNFAKSGNPTPEKTAKIPIKWKPVRTSNLEYLHIGSSKDLHMASNLFPERMNFWANIPFRSNMNLNHYGRRARDEL